MAPAQARSIRRVDAASFLLTIASSLIVGVTLGWYAHVLSGQRSKKDRLVIGAIELLDRSAEVFNARVKYVIAYNRKTPSYPEIREAYHDMKRRYRYADPEVILVGTDEWNEWMTAERAARLEQDVPLEKRIKAVEAASYPVLDALAARRRKAEE